MPQKSHHLSVSEAATTVASCSLAPIYQCFNDLGFSYIPWVKVIVTVNVTTKACLTTVGWGG